MSGWAAFCPDIGISRPPGIVFSCPDNIAAFPPDIVVVRADLVADCPDNNEVVCMDDAFVVRMDVEFPPDILFVSAEVVVVVWPDIVVVWVDSLDPLVDDDEKCHGRLGFVGYASTNNSFFAGILCGRGRGAAEGGANNFRLVRS